MSTVDTADRTSVEDIQKRIERFLNLGWVGHMYTYVETIKGLNPPTPPPDRDGMKTTNSKTGKPLLTLPALMTRAQSNADRWEPLLSKMADIARVTTEYAIAAQGVVEDIYQKTQTELAPDAWAKLTPSQQLAKKKEFGAMVGDLMRSASDNQTVAEKMRDEILGYEKDLGNDRLESQEIQEKYKDWLAQEQQTMSVWERDHGLEEGSTHGLIKALQKDIEAYNARWSGLTVSAVGSAGGTVAFGLVVFPPFGALGGLIAMGVMAAQAAEAKRMMDEFTNRLCRVVKFNEVKIFFSTVDSMLTRMIDAIQAAVEALGEVAGLWGMIAGDLKSVQGRTIGVAGLGGGDTQWEEPVRFVKKSGTSKAYQRLIDHCDVFQTYMYVKERKVIQVGGKK